MTNQNKNRQIQNNLNSDNKKQVKRYSSLMTTRHPIGFYFLCFCICLPITDCQETTSTLFYI